MKKKICIVVANYYPHISKDLVKGSLAILKKYRISNVKVINAPGAFEIPVIISRNINKYDAFIALGCIIKGETPHFNFISAAITQGIMSLSINFKKPIGNGILTCFNKKQALTRSNPSKNNKGGEAAIATLSVLEML